MKGGSSRPSCPRRSSRSCRSPRRRQPASAWGWGRGGLAAGAAGAAFAQHHCWGPYGAAPSLARVWGHPDAPPAPDPRRELTPLEEASLQNQKLKAAYEARVARLNPSQAVQKTSLVSGELGAVGPSPGGFFQVSPTQHRFADAVPAAADDGEPGDRQGAGGDRILAAGRELRAGAGAVTGFGG